MNRSRRTARVARAARSRPVPRRPPARRRGPSPTLSWLLATSFALTATGQFLGDAEPTPTRIALVAASSVLFVFCATRAVALSRARRLADSDDPREDP